jgi:hypothetical protein
MEITNFQWFAIAMDESTNVSNMVPLAIFICGTDMELKITVELDALMQ